MKIPNYNPYEYKKSLRYQSHNQENNSTARTFSISSEQACSTSDNMIASKPYLGDTISNTQQFLDLLQNRQKLGTVGYNAEFAVDHLTEEQISSLNEKYSPYQAMGYNDRQSYLNNILKELVEMGVMTAEEHVLATYSGAGMNVWHQGAQGKWTGMYKQTGQLMSLPDNFKLAGDTFASPMQWIEGATRIDKDNPMANDITIARLKTFDLLKSVFGAPSKTNGFDAFLNNRGYNPHYITTGTPI